MRIVRWVSGDHAAIRACHEVNGAADHCDDPAGPPTSVRTVEVLLTRPPGPAQTWFVPGETPGTAQAFYHLRLPDMENLTMGYLYLVVHPRFRRRGIGGALLRHAARQAAENERSLLATAVRQGSAGEVFARHAGATPGIAEARRVQVLAKLRSGQVAALRESAARAAAGYSLLSWTGRTPDEHLAGFAAVHNAMQDAPRTAGHEPSVWDAQRVRERIDDQRDLFGTRGYSVVARHDATGELAAVTQIEVDPEYPEWAYQQITAVARPHRGHRLGLLVKAAMLEWLAVAEPGLQRILTGNAAANSYMISINEALGYELLDPQSQGYDLPVADALALGSG